ncbi:MAG: hypothetical protein NTW46_02060 [Candidatus Nealsonbacteria bacterium]|nr:hypothetical protein [Candidatus Nealsonbacteria bacterium]
MFEPSTCIVVYEVLAIAAVLIFILGLCKIAAKGNIYCPSCKSEKVMTVEFRGNQIIYACRACGNKW